MFLYSKLGHIAELCEVRYDAKMVKNMFIRVKNKDYVTNSGA